LIILKDGPHNNNFVSDEKEKDLHEHKCFTETLIHPFTYLFFLQPQKFFQN